jgi:hypothetical protein
MNLNLDKYKMPVRTREALERYVVLGIEPGGFLMAVLSNDLMLSFGRADDENFTAIESICKWLYNEAPRSCYGSYEKVETYINFMRDRKNVLT